MISHLPRLGRLGAIAGLLLATFGATGASAATSAAAPASIWSVVPTVSPQSGQVDNSFLQGVSMTSAASGTTWSVVASPNPGGVGNDSLAAVASPGGSVVFAAGAHEISGQCCLRALGLRTASG